MIEASDASMKPNRGALSGTRLAHACYIAIRIGLKTLVPNRRHGFA